MESLIATEYRLINEALHCHMKGYLSTKHFSNSSHMLICVEFPGHMLKNSYIKVTKVKVHVNGMNMANEYCVLCSFES